MILKKYIQYIRYAAQRPMLLGILTIILLAGSFPVIYIHQDPDGNDWLPKSSKKLFVRNQFLKDFGSDELMMLYLTFPASYSKENRIAVLHKLNDTISSSIYGFDNVFSRFNISEISDAIGESYAGKVEHLYFTSKDSSSEMLFLNVRLNKDIITIRPLLIDSLHHLLTAVLPGNIKIHLSGQSVIFNEINKLSSSDSVKLFVLCFLLVFILLWWQVRKFKYFLICLALVSVALIPSVSLIGWLDIPFNMVTMTIPLLFIINFSSFTIHIVTRQSRDLEAYITKKIPPIITSALATVIGFGSLTISNIKVISQFGLFTSLGIIYGLVILIFLGVPLVIRWIDLNELVLTDNWLTRFLDRYYKKISMPVAYTAVLFIGFVMITGVFIFPKIKTDTNIINFMKPKNEVRQTVEYIEKHYGAANIIDFLVAKNNNEPLNSDDFKLVSKANNEISKLSYVKSVIDYSLWRPLIISITATNPTLAHQLRSGFLTKDKSHSRMMINIPAGSVKQMQSMLDAIQAKIDKTLFGSTLEITPAGFLPVYLEEMGTIVKGMLHGLSIAVVLILIVMTLLVRDIKLSVIALSVTLFPLSGIVILMKIMNIPFDVGTSIISSVAIGMIADDALHIIWNYKRHLNRIQPEDKSINILFSNSVRKIIFPCTATSIMFSLGFAVLMFSNMITIVEFGMLTAATIILAWIGDFILFPALLKCFYVRIKQSSDLNQEALNHKFLTTYYDQL